ncbi:hypothetical protein BKA65DRAFT_550218 [Rhexocercosporidium sp. MPI-PUGE-AT-0058]|nr:hypothetical protein BKA65DRAFT_550218 [Rhexocercosporidium sp. MPI-PUGE-AT-0058]
MAPDFEPHADKKHHCLGLGIHLGDKFLSHIYRQQDSSRGHSQQQFERAGLRLMDSHFSQFAEQQLAPGEVFEGEFSWWSSDSSENEFGKNDRDSFNNIKSDAEDYSQETMEDTLERHRRFFQGEPLMRCLKGEEDRYRKWMDTLFYDNLYHEVQQGLRETRSQEVVRAYWEEVRAKLTIDESEINLSSNLHTRVLSEDTHSSSHLGSVVKSTRGWKRPAQLCLLSGKDLELQEIRHLWVDRKKSVGRAATFGKVEVQESGRSSSREDLGRAATFG